MMDEMRQKLQRRQNAISGKTEKGPSISTVRLYLPTCLGHIDGCFLRLLALFTYLGCMFLMQNNLSLLPSRSKTTASENDSDSASSTSSSFFHDDGGVDTSRGRQAVQAKTATPPPPKVRLPCPARYPSLACWKSWYAMRW